MDIDIEKSVNEVLNKAKNAFLKIVTEDLPQVLATVNQYIEKAQKRVAALLNFMANGGSVKFLLDRLADEKDVFKSQVLSLIVIAKGLAQTLVNAFQDILLTAVGKVLPAKI